MGKGMSMPKGALGKSGSTTGGNVPAGPRGGGGKAPSVGTAMRPKS